VYRDVGESLRIVRDLSAHPKVVAIGECGLDYFRDKEQATRDKQKELFEELNLRWRQKSHSLFTVEKLTMICTIY
jgi:Tat protein secretion system quality control protein TatD with DNase activity